MSDINNNIQVTEGENGEFNLGEFISKVLPYWKWFIVSFILCILIALLWCLRTEPIYNVKGKLMINDTKRSESSNARMLNEFGLNGGSIMIENEIIELQSANLMRDVILELDLYVSYYRKTTFRYVDLYKNSPVLVEIDDPENISRNRILNLDFSANGNVKISDEEQNVIYHGEFPPALNLDGYTIRFNLQGDVSNDELRIVILSLDNATRVYSQKFRVNLTAKNANAVDINISDAVPARAMNTFTTLVDIYNSNWIKEKQVVSEQTLDFISDRLDIVNKELAEIEARAESFKKLNNITDIESDAFALAERRRSTEEDLLLYSIEKNILNDIERTLEESGDGHEGLPENLLSTSPSLNNTITQYNNLILSRSKLLQSAKEVNPAILGLDIQLDELKMNIRSSIQKSLRNLEIRTSSITNEQAKIEATLRTIPSKEKEYRSIAREQELKEGLFLFLLQKREENEISKIMNISAARIIEDPISTDHPVSPRKSIFLFLGAVLGGLLPLRVLFVKFSLDNKVHSHKDINVQRAAVLGDIPVVKDKNMSIYQEDFSLTESIHMIREKLNFVLPDKEHTVIMVTSTLPSEGKSFISASLAKAYADIGQKVLLIGCDIRNPQLHKYLLTSSDLGLSSYLAGMEKDPEKLIHNVTENMDAIFGGAVPPNPVQLLSGSRIGKLLDEVKGNYDHVILDIPPIGLLSEGFIFARYSDACIYVVRANELDKKSLNVLYNIEKEKSIKNIAVVVNGVDLSATGYGSKYGDAYRSYNPSTKNGNIITKWFRKRGD